MTNVFDKDPNAVLDYQWDWSTWLAETENIVSATVTVPSGLVLDSQVNANKTVTVWLSGGVDKSAYMITCSITTDNVPPRVDDRSIFIRCRER